MSRIVISTRKKQTCQGLIPKAPRPPGVPSPIPSQNQAQYTDLEHPQWAG